MNMKNKIYKNSLNKNLNKRNNKPDKNILIETNKDIKSFINNLVKPLNWVSWKIRLTETNLPH